MTERKTNGGRRPGAGRKPKGEAPMVRVTFRATPEQKAKVTRNGADWLRRAIDAAEEISSLPA